MPGLSFFAFADLQPHSIGGVYVSSFFPCSAVASCALQHDFAVGARCVQHPLGFPGVVAALPGSADASSQGVVAVAHSGVAALNFGEPVVGAPAVVGGLLRGLLLDEVAPCIPAVGDVLAGSALLYELVQLVVAVAGSFLQLTINFLISLSILVLLYNFDLSNRVMMLAFQQRFHRKGQYSSTS